MAYQILVVDDNASIRRLIRATMEQHDGWWVREAENGKIAVEMVASQKPHLVILDLSMPIMNGLDAAKEISKIAPDVPTIMITTHEFDGLAEVASEAGIKRVKKQTLTTLKQVESVR